MYNDDELLDALREVAAQIESDELTIAKYRREKADEHPSACTIARAFGGWDGALEAAGLD